MTGAWWGWQSLRARPSRGPRRSALPAPRASRQSSPSTRPSREGSRAPRRTPTHRPASPGASLPTSKRDAQSTEQLGCTEAVERATSGPTFLTGRQVNPVCAPSSPAGPERAFRITVRLPCCRASWRSQRSLRESRGKPPTVAGSTAPRRGPRISKRTYPPMGALKQRSPASSCALPDCLSSCRVCPSAYACAIPLVARSTGVGVSGGAMIPFADEAPLVYN